VFVVAVGVGKGDKLWKPDFNAPSVVGPRCAFSNTDTNNQHRFIASLLPSALVIL
jgi:hypothetical protein